MLKKLRFISLILAFVLAFSFKPVVSEAAMKSISFGKAMNPGIAKSGKSATYKLSIKKACLVSMDTKVKGNKAIDIHFYEDKALKNSFGLISITSGRTHDDCYLPKGTYYVVFKGNKTAWKSGKITFTYHTTSINKPNYCANKAIKLNARTWAEYAVTPSQIYERWYKITLKKDQAITLEFPYYFGNNIFIIDSSFKERVFTNDSDETYNIKYYTYEVPAGTYYIKLGNVGIYSPDDYVKFRWY